MAETASPIRRLARHIYTAGGLGDLPRAPGTWGTLMGIPLYFLLSLFHPLYYLIGVGVVFFVGWWAASIAEKDFEKHDDKRVVVDEVFGYLVAMFPSFESLPWWGFVWGFILFRFFDIFKFGPVKWIDKRVGGGLGVMLDDGMAGIFAWIALNGLALLYRLFWLIERA